MTTCDAAAVPSASPPRATIQPGGVLRVALEAAPATLDPRDATDPSSLLVIRQVFETLVAPDASGRPAARLAEGWSSSRDGRTWTFALRRGVRFHDGSALDAASVAATLRRAAPLLGDLVAAVEPAGGESVVLTLQRPFAPLLAALAAPAFAVVSPASIASDPRGWATRASRSAAGTGPFVYRPGAWSADGTITLARNDAYWQRDRDGVALPYLERLELRPIADDAARVSELRAGGVDVAGDLTPGPLVSAARSDPKVQLIERDAASVVYLGLRDALPPLDRPEARRAVALAVDEQAIAAQEFAGDARPASQLVPPGVPGHDDTIVEFARLDTTQAKRLLAEAGWAPGAVIDLVYPASWGSARPSPQRVAERVAADLAKAGIVATPRAADAATYRADVRARRFALWLDEWSGGYLDGDAFLGDLFGAHEPVIAELLRQARADPDGSKRVELYKQVSKLVQQEVLAVPLVHPTPRVAAHQRVRGLVPARAGGMNFTAVWLGR